MGFEITLSLQSSVFLKGQENSAGLSSHQDLQLQGQNLVQWFSNFSVH
jgi:hypothetical protein